MTSFIDSGLVVGHATDVDGATGCTVVRGANGPFRCGVHVVGRATGTRELALLDPGHLVDRVDAILLSGGSAYGLDAAAGVMRWMEERGRGYPVGDGLVVPIVPAAVIFDLAPLGRFDARPTPAMAYDACERATDGHVAEGSVGAGTGAMVGKIAGPASAMKGGIGIGSATAGAVEVRALSVVNALGDIRDAAGSIVAGARDARGRWLDSRAWIARGDDGARRFDALAGRSTTLCVVSTNAALTRVSVTALARAASAALFRRITPVGTIFDGDIVFATAPASHGVEASPAQVETLAVLALEEAIERAVSTLAPGDVVRR